jgi:heterodisulfide reductase subunit A
MMDVGRHPRVELFAYAEVEEVEGFVGNFKVKVRKKARHVREEDCNSCGECAEVCPVVVPDSFQMGLSSRKAVYLPFPQAVPASYIIDMDACLGTNPIACGKCEEVCEKVCIDYDMKDELVELDVGVIVCATGMDAYDPTELDEYCYTRYDNVITSMEFERLICAGGPTAGHFVRPADHTVPKRIAFIQCVGSRNRAGDRGNPYCSNICCMNTVKDTLLLRDHYPDCECTVYYMDIRAFGKGFEDLYIRSKQEGVKYIRGLPGEIREDADTKNLVLTAENTLTGEVTANQFDMVVLSVGVIPRQDTAVVKKLLTLSTTADGFFMEAHPKLKPVDTPTRGVYIAGCIEAPKDVKDSVTQASAAAARAMTLLNAGEITAEAISAEIDAGLCTGCGLCAKVCPFNAIGVDKDKKTAWVVSAMCMGCGNCAATCNMGAVIMGHFTDDQYYAQIDALVDETAAAKVFTFACNWCSYAGADNAGISRLQYPATPRLVRTMCSARVTEDFVLYAFMRGAPVVLVSGCHFADCHYIDANRQTVKRVYRLWDKLEKLGVRPERLQLEWISAAEGQKFARVMREVEELRRQVTAEEIEHTRKVLTEEWTKKLEREAKRRAKAERDESRDEVQVP